MIKISKATKKEIKDWVKVEWTKANLEIYGHPVDEVEKEFRFKVEKNGKLIGIVAGEYQSGSIYISDLIVSNEFRGKGIGTLLMTEAEKYARENGANIIWLVTGKGLRSNSFYKKFGYKKLTDFPKLYYNEDFVIYTKQLK